MKSIQEIFDLLIATGMYSIEPSEEWQHKFMCHSLDQAVDDGTGSGLITVDEYSLAMGEIVDYLEHLGVDSGVSLTSGLINSFGVSIGSHEWMELADKVRTKYCLAIFKDWANRPMIEQVPEFIEECQL